MGDDALHRRLRELFSLELGEAVAALSGGLLQLEQAAPDDAHPLVVELFRTAHSIKGAAMSAGVDQATAVARELEQRLAAIRDGAVAVTPDLVQQLLGLVDTLHRIHGDLEPADVPARAARQEPPSDPGPVREGPPTGPSRPASTPPRSPRTTERSAVRVRPAQVDDLVGHLGELVTVAGQVQALAAALTHADDHGDARSPAAGQGALVRAATAVARDVTRVTEGLAASIERLTLQPFAEACAGLDRTVHDLARASGKQARLVVAGGDVDVDRAVVGVLREPLLHLVRNAVDHGIEPPAERSAAGKPPTGVITVKAALRRGAVTIRVSDDGRGIDADALRAAVPDAPATAAPDALELAFGSGVTTAPEVTDVSGRGIGLDVVRSRVEAIGGTAQLASTPGAGTTVTLTVPVTLALTRVALLGVGDQVVAVPLTAIVRLVRAPADSLQQVAGRLVATLPDVPLPGSDPAGAGGAWPVVPVAALLGLPAAPPAYLVCCRVGPQGVALGVDALIGDREVAVTALPRRLEHLRAVLGVTVLPPTHARGAPTGITADARPVLVLNPAAVTDAAAAPEAPPPEEARRAMRVLVAEDALTTRVLQQRILEAAGYEVITAVDGAQAWELLRRHGADLVVSDVDMPAMDGFELCRAIRRTPELAEVPVVLVTSLGSEQDRRRGVEAGADAYLVKSELQADLLVATVRRLL